MDRRNLFAQLLAAEGFLASVLVSYLSDRAFEFLLVIGIYLIFYAFVAAPSLLKFLDNKFLNSIGASSYSLYLLHQNIGVTFIAFIASETGMRGEASILIPILIIIALLIASKYLYEQFETPMRQIFIAAVGNK